MACFLVPVAEAVVTTVITKAVKSRETEPEALKADTGSFGMGSKIPFSRKLKWLIICFGAAPPCLPLSMYGTAR